MADPRIWTELLTYGLGVALSPIHIVLLLLLLLGRRYSVVPGVHYNKTLRSLHRPIHRTFPYLLPGGKTDD